LTHPSSACAISLACSTPVQNGPQPAHDIGAFGAALHLAVPGQFQNFDLSYNARLGAGYTEQVGMLRARYEF